jgi:hypothetical protein
MRLKEDRRLPWQHIEQYRDAARLFPFDIKLEQ